MLNILIRKKNGKLKVNPKGKNPTDVWQFPKVIAKNRAAKERTPHPAQFPIAVIYRIIQACSNPNEIIFDPFLGLSLKRKFIGFEIRADYCEIAANIIEDLLKEKQVDAEQLSLF